MSITVEMARDFSASTLKEMADAAETRADIVCDFERRPWLRSPAEIDAIDTFRQFAAYARRILAMQSPEPADLETTDGVL